MSVSLEGTGSAKGGQSQDFELNIASIIDCFTVLVTFLLASAAYLSVGLIDAGIAAGGAQSVENQTPPPIQIEVMLKGGYKIDVKVTGKMNKTNSIEAVQDKNKLTWNELKLAAELDAIKKAFPTIQGTILNAEGAVEYGDVVQNMEKIKRVFPVVLLGGY